MSAFLVSDNTMQSAVEAVLIAESSAWHRDWQSYSAKDITELGKALYVINQAALASRYGDNDDAPGFKGNALEGKDLDSGAAAIQRFKNLECLIYQCSEGDVPEHPLYQRIEKASMALARKIVSRSPEWEAAKWGTA